MVSAFALLHPELALARRELLIDAAAAGDFGTFASRDATRIAMVLAAADELTALEPGAATWRGDAPGSLTPSLHVADGQESELPPGDFVANVRRFLAEAPPAWDPFHPD